MTVQALSPPPSPPTAVAAEDELHYYHVLGVPQDASNADIKKARNGLLLTCQKHPDKAAPADRDEANKTSAQINKAFKVLSRPEARRLYDQVGDSGVPLIEFMLMEDDPDSEQSPRATHDPAPLLNFVATCAMLRKRCSCACCLAVVVLIFFVVLITNLTFTHVMPTQNGANVIFTHVMLEQNGANVMPYLWGALVMLSGICCCACCGCAAWLRNRVHTTRRVPTGACAQY